MPAPQMAAQAKAAMRQRPRKVFHAARWESRNRRKDRPDGVPMETWGVGGVSVMDKAVTVTPVGMSFRYSASEPSAFAANNKEAPRIFSTRRKLRRSSPRSSLPLAKITQRDSRLYCADFATSREVSPVPPKRRVQLARGLLPHTHRQLAQPRGAPDVRSVPRTQDRTT